MSLRETYEPRIRAALEEIKTALENKGVTCGTLKASDVPDKIREIQLVKYSLTITAPEFEGEDLTVTKDGFSGSAHVTDGGATIQLKEPGTYRVKGAEGDYEDAEVIEGAYTPTVTLVKKKATLTDAGSDDTTINIKITDAIGKNENEVKIVLKKDGSPIECDVELTDTDAIITNFEYTDGASYTAEYQVGGVKRGECAIEIQASGEPIMKEGIYLCADLDGYPTHIVFTDQKAPVGVSVIDISQNSDKGVVKWLDSDTDTLYVSTQKTGVKVVFPTSSCKCMFNRKKANYDDNDKTQTIDFTNVDTSSTTSMSQLFYRCMSLTSLDLSQLETKNVTDMSFMFAYCDDLPELNLSALNTSHVTNMQGMFSYSNPKSSMFEGFDTSSVKNMSRMFEQAWGYSGDNQLIEEFDLSGFDTSNVTDMSYMFLSSQVGILDLSSFDVSKVENMTNMFFVYDEYKSLTKVYAREWYKEKPLSSSKSKEMFEGRTKLPNYSSSSTGMSKAVWEENGGCFTNPAKKPS